MTAPKATWKWRRHAAKVMTRSDGQCEWLRTDVHVRCRRPAVMVELTKPDGDVSSANMRALCAYHELMAERSREVARYIGIKVRPPRVDG